MLASPSLALPPGGRSATRSASVLRIAIVGPARFDVAAPFAGGMEAHTHALAVGLGRRGHAVTVFARGGDAALDVRPMMPVPAPERGRADVLTDSGAALAEGDSYLEAMLSLAGEGFDIVHVNAVHHVPFACIGLVRGTLTGTLHTPPSPWLVRAARSATVAAGARLVAVSATTAAAWAAVGVEVDVILNGVDTATWSFGPGGGGAVWSGRLVPEKAPHLAIAAARAAGVPLTLYGPRHDADYFDSAIGPELDGHVRYGGHLGPEDLARALRRASVALVTPVWDEPFGLVVAEALSCGTPVAGFNRGALAELLDDETGVLAAPGDVDALADALVRAQRLDRRRCRARAERAFSRQRMIDAYEAWFTRSARAG